MSRPYFRLIHEHVLLGIIHIVLGRSQGCSGVASLADMSQVPLIYGASVCLTTIPVLGCAGVRVSVNRLSAWAAGVRGVRMCASGLPCQAMGVASGYAVVCVFGVFGEY